MKTRTLLLAFFTLFALSAHAQYYYKSEGFEKKGLNEYIEFAPDNQVHYWTNKNPRRISLTTVKIEESRSGEESYLKVKFPQGKAVYTLKLNSAVLFMECIHPNGRKQRFYRVLPSYVSKGFEKKGMNEYLEQGMMDWSYWTSANKKKIKLIVKWSGLNRFGDMSYKVAFPGSSQTYMLSISGKGRKAKVTCIHPNGKHQEFSAYYQN